VDTIPADELPRYGELADADLLLPLHLRARMRRIDYYPGEDAQAAIDARTCQVTGGDYSSIIDALVLAGAEHVPARRRK